LSFTKFFGMSMRGCESLMAALMVGVRSFVVEPALGETGVMVGSASSKICSQFLLPSHSSEGL
jgi:hypothetical protein